MTTTAYGDLHKGSGGDQYYTDEFAGTSSASPIVAGAIACLQWILRANGTIPLDGKQVQGLLRSTGSPQEDGPRFKLKDGTDWFGYPQEQPERPKTEIIGNRPNLRELIARL